MLFWTQKNRHYFGSKTRCKKGSKNWSNLEAKIDTYLEVRHGAKWDAKVVEKMDAILDAHFGC